MGQLVSMSEMKRNVFKTDYALRSLLLWGYVEIVRSGGTPSRHIAGRVASGHCDTAARRAIDFAVVGAFVLCGGVALQRYHPV